MSLKITFHGACGTVTGSCFEVRTNRAGILIDCGMFQGSKTAKSLNYEAFPFTPSTIAAVLLTHAHIDHCGLIPRLVSHGFSGPVHTTAATAGLLDYVLPDSGFIQELEVERLNRRNAQRGRPEVTPIYTHAEAQASLSRVRPHELDTWITVAPGFRARFWDAAHILGSVSIELEISEAGEAGAGDTRRLLFSGDIGPGNKDFHGSPEAPSGVDYVVMESTYGDRRRLPSTSDQRRRLLAAELRPALLDHGLVLIPAFAVERTQELLADLAQLFAEGKLPRVPVFLDSPLAIKATKVFATHLNGDNGEGVLDLHAADIHFVEDANESRKLNRLKGGAIIMAGSGMCDAGRIRHHLKAHLAGAQTTVLLVGYQAPGTLGHLLSHGAAMVRIQGEEVAVAARIRKIDEYSGHADQVQLVAWAQARLPVKQDFILVHGEDAARENLRDVLAASGVPAARIKLPLLGETFRLTDRGAETVSVRARAPSSSVLAADWHNQYAASILALKGKLDAAPDDDTRQKLLERVRAAIGK